MKVYEKINSLDYFLKTIRDFSLGRYIYRGQSVESWHLLPSLARIFDNLQYDHPFSDWSYLQIEDNLIKEFIRRSMPYLVQKPTSFLEWLSVAQHYRLPTRLLDWSENPLVGLFFAVAEHFEDEGAVWAMKPTVWQSLDIDIFRIEEEFITFFPNAIDHRIISQKGCFTIQTLKSDPYTLIPVENLTEKLYFDELIKIVIPASNKEFIMRELSVIGIGSDFLFPGLSGLCDQIKFDFRNNLIRF